MKICAARYERTALNRVLCGPPSEQRGGSMMTGRRCESCSAIVPIPEYGAPTNKLSYPLPEKSPLALGLS